MLVFGCRNAIPTDFSLIGHNQIRFIRVNPLLGFSKCRYCSLQKATGLTAFTEKVIGISPVNCSQSQSGQPQTDSGAVEKRKTWKVGKKSAGSLKKALNLIRIVSSLPNVKEAVYGALDKWSAWETEFPVIAVAKALRILRRRGQWKRVIQIAKWMLSKGQGVTMGTYDTLLLAFDMDQRVDEAESLWKMILQANKRSISRQLFSRMISLYDRHSMPDKIIEIFADMEELEVKPDEGTTKKIALAFKTLGQEDEQKVLIKNYPSKAKQHISHKGE